MSGVWWGQIPQTWVFLDNLPFNAICRCAYMSRSCLGPELGLFRQSTFQHHLLLCACLGHVWGQSWVFLDNLLFSTICCCVYVWSCLVCGGAKLPRPGFLWTIYLSAPPVADVHMSRSCLVCGGAKFPSMGVSTKYLGFKNWKHTSKKT
jgi:hypothetical protein